jgi:hypothetical protein
MSESTLWPTKEQLRVKLIMSEVEDEEDKRGRVGEGWPWSIWFQLLSE